MMNLIPAIIGIALVTLFLGIMLANVPAIPLIVIVVCVLGMMLYDFWGELRGNKDR
jgi:hypothetical protein